MSFEPGAQRVAGVIPLSQPVIAARVALREGVPRLGLGVVGGLLRFAARAVGARFFSCAVRVAVASGTAALHVALLLAGVRPGDGVVVPALTFIAPASAVTIRGARRCSVDAEPDYLQLDPERFAPLRGARLPQARADGAAQRHRPPVTAVVPVHVLGHPCDMDAVAAIAASQAWR